MSSIQCFFNNIYCILISPQQVRVSKVQVENTSYHSVELQGPVLPDAVLGLCDLLKPTCEQFSLTFANLELTKVFSEAVHAAGNLICVTFYFAEMLLFGFDCQQSSSKIKNFTISSILGTCSSPNEKENQSTTASTPACSVFGQENLSDCGLSKNTLERFCSSDNSNFHLLESLKYCDGSYTWM